MTRSHAVVILLIPALFGQAPAPIDGEAAARASKAKREYLRAMYLEDASSYTIYRDGERKEKLTLRQEPSYVWTNPTRNGGQDGHVFVWTGRGRAEVVGTIFSSPELGTREVLHELHSLSLSVLDVERTGGREGWKPLQPGIELKSLPSAPAPAKEAPQRMTQMRNLIREFSASAIDIGGHRWELRVLPQPLYRYESTDPAVLDGAVFTLVSSAGTDPELMIVLEARKDAGKAPAAPAWRFGAARFSDMALSVRHKDQVVYSAPVIPWDASIKDPTHRYHLIKDRNIPPVEKAISTDDSGPGASATRKEPGRNP